MKTFYSAKAGGFYQEGLLDAYASRDALPLDLVEIDAVTYQHCMAAPGRGQFVVAGMDGRPVCEFLPSPTSDEIARANSSERDVRLSKAALRIAPLQDAEDTGVATEAELDLLLQWKLYRVALNRLNVNASGLEWPREPGPITA